MLNKLITLEKKLLKLEENFVALAMLLLVLFQLLQIFFRYVLTNPLAWIDESSRYLFIWMIMVGAAVGVQWLAHFSVPILADRFPKVLRNINQAFVMMVTAGFIGILAVYGFIFFETAKGQVTPALNLPIAVPYMAIPVGCILMLVHLLVNVIKMVKPSLNELGDRLDDSEGVKTDVKDEGRNNERLDTAPKGILTKDPQW